MLYSLILQNLAFFEMYIIYKASLHKVSFQNTPQKRTLLGEEFWMRPCFCFMQLFIHRWRVRVLCKDINQTN